MKYFDKLTDQSKINRLPERIKIQSVTQSGSLESILKKYNTPSSRLEELAILNGMQLNQQVRAGTKIKTIGK